MDLRLQFVVEDLLTRYVHCIDDGRYEEWPGFFADPCIYHVISAENYERGLPIGLIFANSQGMLQDRVTALREANIYEPQRYRHLVGSVQIESVADGIARVRANYQVVRIMQDGSASLFSVGRYLDQVVIADDRPRFREKRVVFDNQRVDTLLAIPL